MTMLRRPRVALLLLALAGLLASLCAGASAALSGPRPGPRRPTLR